MSADLLHLASPGAKHEFFILNENLYIANACGLDPLELRTFNSLCEASHVLHKFLFLNFHQILSGTTGRLRHSKKQVMGEISGE